MKFLSIAIFVTLPFFLIGQLQLAQSGIYGTACGFAGEILEERKFIEKLIKEDNFELVLKRLSAVDPVDKIYAYEAYIRLQIEKERMVTEDIRVLLSNLETDDSLITTCMGCFQRQESVSSVVSKIKVEYNYKE